ncbi:MAG: LytTR family DNA-binding domain-containing protein [Gemmatimonadota bacterium]
MIHRVLLVDDEPLARERLSGMVRAYQPDADVREVGNGDQAVEMIRDWAPELVFLDVQMPGRDGFEVVAAIGAEQMPPTVFVTAFDRHAIRAFEVAAVDYLLKPFDEARFRAAWHRGATQKGLRTLMAESTRLAALFTEAGGTPSRQAARTAPPDTNRRWADRVVVKKDQRTTIVSLATVQFIESSGNYAVLHAGSEQHVVRETLSSLESRLDPERFVRIHRRVIVAIDAIRELQPWFGGDQVLILRDGRQLRVSRSQREHVARRLAGLG